MVETPSADREQYGRCDQQLQPAVAGDRGEQKMRADAEECLLQRVLQERDLDREQPLGRAVDVGGRPAPLEIMRTASRMMANLDETRLDREGKPRADLRRKVISLGRKRTHATEVAAHSKKVSKTCFPISFCSALRSIVVTPRQYGRSAEISAIVPVTTGMRAA